MKKFVCAVLAMVMMLALAVSACAQSADFSFNAPCKAIDDSQLYLYHGYDYVDKETDNHTLQVKYHVVQSSADETNRIAAYSGTTYKTMGAHWIPANSQKYPITSNAIINGNKYTAAGRGNTNYASKYGLNNITITGIIYSDD